MRRNKRKIRYVFNDNTLVLVQEAAPAVVVEPPKNDYKREEIKEDAKQDDLKRHRASISLAAQDYSDQSPPNRAPAAAVEAGVSQ